jgi:hypothetical protein
VISQGFWPACSPDLNPCDFYLWDTLKVKVYVNKPLIMSSERKYLTGNFIIPRLFQDNDFAMCLETFFQDMRPA